MICEYGCGKEAKHQFKNGKWCCESSYSRCSNVRRKNSESNKKVWRDPNSVFNSTEYKDKQSRALKGIQPWNKGKTKETDERILKQSLSLKKAWKDEDNYLNSDEYRNSLKEAQNRPEVKRKKSVSKKYTIKDIKEKYPLFSKIEDMRYNLDNPDEIQVHCKNHKCENSKEKDGWFTPTYIQLYERIRAIERNGVDHAYFYCSQECKDSCILYGLSCDPFEKVEIPYTQEEYNIWKQTVLEQDNYECQKCGSKENLHCHHIVPIKENEMLALDPDNGIVLCQKCHYEVGHKTSTECSTGNLASCIKK